MLPGAACDAGRLDDLRSSDITSGLRGLVI